MIDTRSTAEWIGDIGYRTLERLEDIGPELTLLARQFHMLAGWAADNHLGGTATDLRIQADALEGLRGPVQTVIEATGRDEQAYLRQSGLAAK